MTQEKCDGIASAYKSRGAGDGEIMPSCPEEETDSCQSETGTGSVYMYNSGTSPIPMQCTSLLTVL